MTHSPTGDELVDMLAALADQLAAGTLRAAVDRTFPLADAGAAITYLRDGHAKGKVVVTV